MKKTVFYSEIAYVIGFWLLALGTALISHGGFGMSMVVAPAYILHLKLSQVWPWFSFGISEYVLQALVLSVLMLLMRKVRLKYFLSVVAAVVYGLMLDGSMFLVGLLPINNLWSRLAVYGGGVLLCTCAISLLFHSYFPPAAYELFVKELAQKYGKPMSRLKTLYDCGSLLLSILLSLCLFGAIEGVGVGTAVCALIYGTLIRWFSKLFRKFFQFQDCFGIRSKFEEREVSV